ncbi:MAG: hypothetical protein LBG44_04310, partial [Gemmatimonadota bacterium]|nr:hypothetical protein [Gemmatimonadota bacterium]
MCVLCDKESLRLLSAPLASLSNRRLAEAIAIAREAALQLVLDTADSIAGSSDRTEARRFTSDSYMEYVIDRALKEGAVRENYRRAWLDSMHEGSALNDPRVQAFLSSAAEGFASYTTRITEHQEALEQFLEERTGAVVFAGVGVNGEVVFDRGRERYVVLSDDEAMRIAMDRVANNLCHEDPKWLLEYTNLPAGASDVLASMQKGDDPDRANDILAGIVDIEALTEDRVRQIGYGPFVAEGITEEFTEQRFGDRIIIRLRLVGGT